MKIYFACSIRGGRGHADMYQALVDSIKATGATVLSELFANKTIEALEGTKHKPTDREIWADDVALVQQADAVIADVTNASLGVGYEIAKAEEWGKPVLCLYYPGPDRRLSAMIAGSPGVINATYRSIEEADKAIKKFIASHK
jgi:nucleoside 2-deoxyribosyltransferase